MSMTYNWKVDWIKKINTLDELNNVVIEISWFYSGKRADGYESFIKGITEYNNVTDSQNFIPFVELTEEIILSWVQNSISAEQLVQYQYEIEKDIESKATTKIYTAGNLPWEYNEPAATESISGL